MNETVVKKEDKKTKSKGLIVVVALLALVATSLGIYGYYANNEDEGLTNEVKKIDVSKGFVYDANYIDGCNVVLDKTSEAYESWDEDYNLEDFKVPYINIDSDASRNSNSEIKTIYCENLNIIKDIIEEIKEELATGTSGGTSLKSLNYEYFTNDNILSIVITKDDYEKQNYYTYNLSLKTGELLNFEDIYKTVDLTSSNVKEKLEEAIISKYDAWYTENDEDNSMREEYYEELKNETITNFENDLNDNKIGHYLDASGKLNIAFIMHLPEGSGDFPYVVTVK